MLHKNRLASHRNVSTKRWDVLILQRVYSKLNSSKVSFANKNHPFTVPAKRWFIEVSFSCLTSRLLASLGTLETQRKRLIQKQEAYRKAEAESTGKRQAYEALNKAFLDEQAGVLASTLAAGMPCPVCGSTDHPCLAVMAENAPTEEAVKAAKEDYETAQETTNAASAAASAQKAVVTTNEATLVQEADALLPGTSLEGARSAAEEKVVALAEQIDELDKRITVLEKQETRRDDLDEQIPEKEIALADARKTETESKAQVAALSASISELKKQIALLQGKLQFADKAEAESQKKALQKNLDALKKTLTDAEKCYNTCKEELAGIRSAIEQLTAQLAESCEIEAEALEEEKQTLLSKKKELTDQKQDVHTRIITNG